MSLYFRLIDSCLETFYSLELTGVLLQSSNRLDFGRSLTHATRGQGITESSTQQGCQFDEK